MGRHRWTRDRSNTARPARPSEGHCYRWLLRRPWKSSWRAFNGNDGSLDIDFDGDGIVTRRYGDLNDGKRDRDRRQRRYLRSRRRIFRTARASDNLRYSSSTPTADYRSRNSAKPELCFPNKTIRLRADPRQMHSLSRRTERFSWRGQASSRRRRKHVLCHSLSLRTANSMTTFGAEQGNAGVVTTDITTSDDGALALAVDVGRHCCGGFRRSVGLFTSRLLSSNMDSTAS